MNKANFLLISLLLAQSVWAGPVYKSAIDHDEIETTDIELVDAPAQGKVKIKDIKNLLGDLDNGSTCIDEYLKRRKQLLIKFAFTPVTLTAAAAAGVAAGGLSGVALAELAGVRDGGWTALGYFVGGAMVGTATTVVVITADTTLSGLNYYDNDLMLKSLGEYYLDRDLTKFEQLYDKATKKMANKPSFDEFVERVVSLDQSGALCDGSLVKQPRIRLGSKLKYKVARPKDLKKAF